MMKWLLLMIIGHYCVIGIDIIIIIIIIIDDSIIS